MENARGANFGLLSQDGSRVMLWNWTSPQGEVRLYDATTGKNTGGFQPDDRVGYRPILSPNGRYVTWANKRNDVTLYDAVTGKIAATLRSSKPLPKAECDDASLLFSPDSEYLIVTTYSNHFLGKPADEKWHTSPTRVFEVASGKEISRFYVNPDTTSKAMGISCAACSKDKRFLAVAEEDSSLIRIIDVASGKEHAQLAGHRHGVRGLAFSPDGTTLASGGMDNVTYLWDLTGTRTGKAEKKE
jgi:WD40 repeat protein